MASSEYLLVQKISFVHINTCHPSAFQSKLFLHGLITTLLSLLRKYDMEKWNWMELSFSSWICYFSYLKDRFFFFFLYLARERDSKLDLQLEMNVDGIILDLDT